MTDYGDLMMDWALSVIDSSADDYDDYDDV